ncbi:MAG: heparan-alpha-glucosaminide N-acetyltransferase domain-containing protein [Myxococcota bacterium]
MTRRWQSVNSARNDRFGRAMPVENRVTVKSIDAIQPAAEPDRPVRSAKTRVVSVDVLRGLVMVLMALDHTRDYVHRSAISPTDLAETTPVLFFTRWITHLCAPVFILLAGVSAGFVGGRSDDRGALSRFLVVRGLWLIVLEFTVIAFAWRFHFNPRPMLLVVWVIGASMVLLGALVWLPRSVHFMLALLLCTTHNLFDGIAPETFGWAANLWSILHVSGPLTLGDTSIAFVGYPLIPWVGVMSLGYLMADLYRWDPRRRRQTLVFVGVGLLVAFVILRGFNLYGDPQPWQSQNSVLHTFMAILNVAKYPPSLSYLLMTLGPALIFLAATENLRGLGTRFFLVFGRVPLFYYIVHIYLIHAIAVVLGVSQGFAPGQIAVPFFGLPEDYGFGLFWTYVAWVAVLAALYLPCRRWLRLKADHRHWVLRYL